MGNCNTGIGSATSNNKNTSVAENPRVSTSAPQTPTEKKYEIGDTFEAEGLAFTINEIRQDKGESIFKPDTGNILYVVNLTIENRTAKAETISSLIMFNLFDSDGYSYGISIKNTTAKSSLDGTLEPGKKMRGEVTFEIPKDASGLELQITPEAFSSNTVRVSVGK